LRLAIIVGRVRVLLILAEGVSLTGSSFTSIILEVAYKNQEN